MTDVLVNVAIVVALLWLFDRLEKWRLTACRCGREKMPWFHRKHVKEWVMAAFCAWFALSAVGSALRGSTVMSIIAGLVMLFHIKAIIEHRKGKRSILGRLLGYIRFNEHGRLVVEQQ